MKIDKKIIIENIKQTNGLMLFHVHQCDPKSVTTTLTELKKLMSKGDYQITVVKI